MRDDLGLVRIPKRMWPLFKKCAKNLHFPDVTGRESGDEVIFMSGVPLHMAEEILESIESGEVQPTLLRIAFQDMWVGANKKATWTVWCPKYGRICSAHNICTESRKDKGTRGYTIIRDECQYYVEVKVEGIMCLHPRAEDFQDRSPWKVEETTEGLPLFDPREVK